MGISSVASNLHPTGYSLGAGTTTKKMAAAKESIVNGTKVFRFEEDTSVWHSDNSKRTTYTIEDAVKDSWDEKYNTAFLFSDDGTAMALKLKTVMPGTRELTEELRGTYTKELQENGFSPAINWNMLESDFNGLEMMNAGRLAEDLDYIASRYTAVYNQLERNYSGDELAAQKEKLAQIFQRANKNMVDDYAERIQHEMGFSDTETQKIKDSLQSLLDQRVQVYQEAYAQVADRMERNGEGWLENCHCYVASQLRQAVDSIDGQTSGGEYTLDEIKSISEVAGAYQELYKSCMSNGYEASLALNIGMLDMKVETLIEQGLVNSKTADLLRSTRGYMHQTAMDLEDQWLDRRRAAGGNNNDTPAIDRDMVNSIYEHIMSRFQQNGGDALSAIRDSVSYGLEAAKKAYANTPNLRWGNSMQTFWNDFYTSYQGQYQVKQSTYQTYEAYWQSFVEKISAKNPDAMKSRGVDFLA